MSEHEAIKSLSGEIEKLKADLQALSILRNVDSSMIQLFYKLLSVDATAKTLSYSSVAATMKEFRAQVIDENNSFAAMILAELQKILGRR